MPLMLLYIAILPGSSRSPSSTSTPPSHHVRHLGIVVLLAAFAIVARSCT